MTERCNTLFFLVPAGTPLPPFYAPFCFFFFNGFERTTESDSKQPRISWNYEEEALTCCRVSDFISSKVISYAQPHPHKCTLQKILQETQRNFCARLTPFFFFFNLTRVDEKDLTAALVLRGNSEFTGISQSCKWWQEDRDYLLPLQQKLLD